jgi:hypothetical protein
VGRSAGHDGCSPLDVHGLRSRGGGSGRDMGDGCESGTVAGIGVGCRRMLGG